MVSFAGICLQPGINTPAPHFLKGPYMLTSRGCNLCERWDGKDKSTTPLFLHLSRVSMLRCEEWLSSNNTIGSSLDGFVCKIKWFKNLRNDSSIIHPVPVAAPVHPVGLSLMKWSLKIFLRNINMGRMNVPCAHTAAATVTSYPIPVELTSPICFTPFTPIILFGFNTVVTPVSSMFQILDRWKGWREKTSPNFWKNSPTLFKLNAVILPKLVLSGCLIERFLFLF